MDRQSEIAQLIHGAIAELNQTLEPEHALRESPDTVLIGDSAELDSLGLVNFIAIVEERIKRTLAREISLIDVLLPAEDSRWTVGALTARLSELLFQEPHNGRHAPAAFGV